MKRQRTTLALLTGLWCFLAPLARVQDDDTPRLVVAVHPDNEVSLDEKEARSWVRKLFLKEVANWPDGTRAKPFDRRSRSKEQKLFRERVLKMSAAELVRHWLKMKNLKGATPPREVSSDRMMAKYIARQKGALGLVDKEVAEKEGLRILFEVESGEEEDGLLNR